MTASEELLRVDVDGYQAWRDAARRLLTCGAAPETILWIDRRSQLGRQQLSLQELGNTLPDTSLATASTFRVPQSFLDLSKTVAQHRSPERWSLLYRLLWRITGGERHLLDIASDTDVHRVRGMEKAIHRDAHKMKAFVRFRATGVGDDRRFVAWHRPDHYVVPVTAGFFARRFDVMKWAILTPDESVIWDGKELEFGPGCPRAEAPSEDEMESLWKVYYASIFNPARIKIGAMCAEMPKKHWATMPETELIAGLIRQAPRRVDEMVEKHNNQLGAEPFVPNVLKVHSKTNDGGALQTLRRAASVCQGCDLHGSATQTVFGVGPASARLMLVGEQPGDQEDLAGLPFVGPAGQSLDDVLAEVGLNREQIYVTNAVKHFKWKPVGKRRLHVKPASREISACRPWLVQEIETVRPAMIVCLGATAASVIVGPSFRITKQRGEVFKTDFARWTMATYHPSALLRVPDEASRQTMRQLFTADLAAAADYLRNL